MPRPLGRDGCAACCSENRRSTGVSNQLNLNGAGFLFCQLEVLLLSPIWKKDLSQIYMLISTYL